MPGSAMTGSTAHTKTAPLPVLDDNIRIMEQNPPPLPPLEQSGWGASKMQQQNHGKSGIGNKKIGFGGWGKKRPGKFYLSETFGED